MKLSDQVLLSRYMEKRAAGLAQGAWNSLGENNFERGAGAFSMIPAIGWLGNAASGLYNIGRGRFGRGMADLGMGAASLFTGGLANDIGKGVRAGGALAKTLPTFSKGFGALGRTGFNAGMKIPGAKPLFNSGLGRLTQSAPRATGWGSNIAGNTYKDYESTSYRAPQNSAFDNITGVAKNAPNIMGMVGGGSSFDPREMTPPATPAPMSPTFN